MEIVKHRKIFFAFTAFLLALSGLSLLVFGLRPSIDFAGGEIFEISFEKGAEKSEIAEKLQGLNIGSFSLRASSSNGSGALYILRTPYLENDERKSVNEAISLLGGKIERYASVGPIIGEELKKKAQVAIILTIIAIILFIAWAFREVSKPVSSWKYGIVAIIALLHDIAVPLGFFAFLGYFVGAEIDTLFVMALLAILGYSVNDTIVIFDRVRERLKTVKEKKIKEGFQESVGKALSQTVTRSINTSFTTALVLLFLYVLGAESTKYFALTLLVGVLAGTYSSIFLAAPLLIEFARIGSGKKDKSGKG